MVRSYCGHGIGDVFHANLQIPHYFDARSNTKMELGMTFTIEPMICMGTWEELHWDDGWTVVTKDLAAIGAVRAHRAGHRGRCRDPHQGRLKIEL